MKLNRKNYKKIKNKNIKKIRKLKKFKKNTDKTKIPDKICILGLIPFVFISLNYKSNIALLVLINGLLFHSRFIEYLIMRYIDIFCNFLMILYVIYVCKFDYYIYIIIALAIICYIINMYTNLIDNIFIKYSINIIYIKSIFHVIFVQWILSYGLIYVYKNNLIVNKSLTIF